MSNGSPLPLAVCEFEIVPVHEPLVGEIEAAIFELGGTDPTAIIGSDQAWYVRVRWRLRGILKRHICGTWCICVYLERLGPGPDIRLECRDVPIDPCLPDREYYEAVFNVAPGSVAFDDCGTLYCVAVVLTSKDPCGGAGHISGFCREACVLIRQGPVHSPGPASNS